MDNGLILPTPKLPVTLALACALENAGNLFVTAQAIAESNLAAGAAVPLGRLMCDIIAPLLEMGAIYADGAGNKHIDRQAICDFGIVVCGLSRATVMYELTLHELALYHRRMAPLRDKGAVAPSADFLAEMQGLFPDIAKDKEK